MSKIRKSAAGKPCLVRLPGICNGDPETTVAAHIRVAGLCGVGMKPPDICTVRACHNCHLCIDGGYESRYLSRSDIRSFVLDAICRTLVEYEKEGLIQIVGAK